MKNGSSITIWNIMWAYLMGAGHAYITTNVKPTIEGEKADVFFTSDIEELIDPATGNSLARSVPRPRPRTLPPLLISAVPSNVLSPPTPPLPAPTMKTLISRYFLKTPIPP
jgi:hypothetical protein